MINVKIMIYMLNYMHTKKRGDLLVLVPLFKAFALPLHLNEQRQASTLEYLELNNITPPKEDEMIWVHNTPMEASTLLSPRAHIEVAKF